MSSDLSRLLDDLYALPSTEDAPIEREATRAPEWSSEEALDDVFANWTPGPSDDASAAERSIVADVASADAAVVPDVDDWLKETAPVTPELVAVGALRWSPSDDDILPPRRRRQR